MGVGMLMDLKSGSWFLSFYTLGKLTGTVCGFLRFEVLDVLWPHMWSYACRSTCNVMYMYLYFWR